MSRQSASPLAMTGKNPSRAIASGDLLSDAIWMLVPRWWQLEQRSRDPRAPTVCVSSPPSNAIARSTDSDRLLPHRVQDVAR